MDLLENLTSDNLNLKDLMEISETFKNLNTKEAKDLLALIWNMERADFREEILKTSLKEQYKFLNTSEETPKEKLNISSISEYKDKFFNNITSDNYKTYSSGIDKLDNLINGGFINKTTCIIGGASNLGKSTFVLQIIDSLLNERPVIYFSLEMEQDLILSKILSRYSFTNATSSTTKLSNDIILKDSRTNENIRKQVKELLNILPSKYNDLYIVKPTEPTLEEIKKIVDKELEKIESKRIDYINELKTTSSTSTSEFFNLSEEQLLELAKEKYKNPILVLDYIQLIQPSINNYGRAEEIATTIKKVNRYFHNYANDNNSISFMITAYNRETTENKQALSLGSGRDTSDLEYSADLMLGLNFREYEESIASDKRKNLESPIELKEKYKPFGYIPLKLVKLKDRKGTPTGKENIDFYGAYSYFESKINESNNNYSKQKQTF